MGALTPARDQHVMAAVEDSPMRRSSALAMVVLMSWMSLGACYFGPDPVQYASLAVIDGRPTAVVAACGRSTVNVRLYLNDNTANHEFHPWYVTITLPKPVQEVEVELLGPARPGWEITSKEETRSSSPGDILRVVPLTSIEPLHHYTLDSSTGGPEGSSAPAVTFTTDDLLKIGPGQVLAPIDHRRSKVVSRDSFIKERCG
jgi:hypothetical protein